MNNLLKSKTRLTFIQIIFENLSTQNDINEIFNTFETKYKSTFIENFHDKNLISFDVIFHNFLNIHRVNFEYSKSYFHL